MSHTQLQRQHWTLPNADNDNGPFWLYDGPFWTIFLEIKIFGAVLVGAVLAMGRFGIDPI